MKGVDTNLLVRFLTGDDKEQAGKVYALFKKAEMEKNTLFVPLLVLLELIWVLESVYEISRSEILEALSELLLMSCLQFEQQATVRQFTINARENSYDLADLLIAHSAETQGCRSVLTLDKKASGFNLFELL